MRVIKLLLHILGWLATFNLQAAASWLIIYLCAAIYYYLVDPHRIASSESPLPLFMFGITLPGTVAGINLVGWLALRWVWKDIPPRTRQRLICSTVSVLIFMVIPALIFLVLVPITDIWDADLFYLLLIALVQFGPLVAGLVGYHRPWLAHDPN